VRLLDGLLALLGGMLVVGGVVVLAVLGITIWAIVDACHQPQWAWSRIGQNRALWVGLLLVSWLATGIVGFVLALVYLASVRPRLQAAMRNPPPPLPPTRVPEHVRVALRVGDADRDHAGAWLRHHYSVGRLSYDELLQRLDEAYASRTIGDLERSLRELPQR
jgi:Domain of unknown function (DUF1707)/Protein of unknown function (DUF2516)